MPDAPGWDELMRGVRELEKLSKAHIRRKHDLMRAAATARSPAWQAPWQESVGAAERLRSLHLSLPLYG